MESNENFNRDFKGIWIPKEIWLNDNLTVLDKVLLMEIDSLDNQDTHCIASNKYLADFCRCTETKISTSISTLKNMGYIEIISFDGRRRIIQSRLSKNSKQTLKNLKADFKKFKDINIDNNIDYYNIKEKTIKESQTDILNALKKEFEDVWVLYPRHQGKSEAFKHYVKARQSGVEKETIENGILNYRSYISKASLPIQYVKHGSSWFNQKGWENDYEYDTNNYTERRYKTQQERNREFLAMKMKEYQDEENRNS